MIIIGEKINGAIPSVSKAIETRDEEAFAGLSVSRSTPARRILTSVPTSP
jgi:hypothetical protein